MRTLIRTYSQKLNINALYIKGIFMELLIKYKRRWTYYHERQIELILICFFVNAKRVCISLASFLSLLGYLLYKVAKGLTKVLIILFKITFSSSIIYRQVNPGEFEEANSKNNLFIYKF